MRLYRSDAYGPDYEQAYHALIELERLDPAYDRVGLQAANALFAMDRMQEAWSLYSEALQSGERDMIDLSSLYRAGIAASHTADIETARRLLREALWIDPKHDLADKAREILR